MSTELPDRITVTFTEEDRQNAERYSDICGCLLYTALKRMDMPVSHVGGDDALIGESGDAVRYTFAVRQFHPEDILDEDRQEKPFYRESVVGDTLVLHRDANY